MTEYDHWPPIRFRFAGDVEQAKGRIPQARTLMSQLIRRMEGQERDAGQWQGQLSDGTQFRVAKMGDVHVADIFGVAPAQMPDTVSAVDYGQRDNEMPLTEGVVMPEIPEAPHVNPREILMRPHGERFKDGGGNYLWVGVGFDPSVLYTDYPRTFPSETHSTVYYSGNVPQPDKTEFVSVPAYSVLSAPTFNIIVYEPGWNNEESEGGVFQSNYAGHRYSEDQKNTPDYLTSDIYWYQESYAQAYRLVNINHNQDQDSETPGTVPRYLTLGSGVITSKTGLESGYPLLYAGEFNLPVYASVTLDPEPTVLAREDLRQALTVYEDSYLRAVATGFGPTSSAITSGVEAVAALKVDTKTWETPDALIKWQTSYYSTDTILLSDVPLKKANEEDGTFSDDPITMGNVKGKVLDGYYEIRVSAGGIMEYAIPDSFPIDVYIQTKKGQQAKKYTVTINDAYTYPEGNWAGDIRDFNWKGWMDSKETTDNRTGWYNGCWLIDIKKGTVIHETDPANLDRPWFTQ